MNSVPSSSRSPRLLHGLVAQQIRAMDPESRVHLPNVLVEAEWPFRRNAAVRTGEPGRSIAVVTNVLHDAALGREAFRAFRALEILGSAAIGRKVVWALAGYRQLDYL